jgi:cytoskeleton protein RodZ
MDTTSMRFGEELKAERERRGISLNEVAVSTRVSMRHLHALEEDNYRQLPGGVFNRGIVRSYAQHCGMDVDSTVDSFQRALRDSGIDTEIKDEDWVQFAEAVRRSRESNANRRRWRWLGVLAMILAVLGLSAGVLWVLVHRGIVHLPQRKRDVANHALLQLVRWKQTARWNIG